MRKKILAALAAAILSAAPLLRAEPVNYEQVPADSKGFLHIDVEAVRAEKSKMFPADESAMSKKIIPPDSLPTSITGVLGQNLEPLLLVHGSKTYCDSIVLPINFLRPKEAVAFRIRYGDREISCFALSELLKANGIADLAKLVSETKTSADNKSVLAEQLLLHELDTRNLYFTYLEDKGLIVLAVDLRSLVRELDVLSNKADSLAKSDASRIKADAVDAIVVASMDLTPFQNWFAEDDSDAADSDPNSSVSKLLSLDLTDSIKGKLQKIELVVSAGARTINIDPRLTMADSASADDLQKLILGMKSLFEITKPKTKPFLDSLTATSANKCVSIHWFVTEAGLSELTAMMK